MYTDLETGSLAMNPNLSDEEWKKYAANVQKCADRVAENGFVGVFHPHVDSHVQTEADILCFDTGHHVYADRMIATESLPVKKKMDEEKWSFARAVYEDIMVEPGKGSIDFKKFYEALVEKNYDGRCVVEQDLFPVKSFDLPLKLAKIGRENLREAGFK